MADTLIPLSWCVTNWTNIKNILHDAVLKLPAKEFCENDAVELDRLAEDIRRKLAQRKENSHGKQ